jgi:hypothetical protein
MRFRMLDALAHCKHLRECSAGVLGPAECDESYPPGVNA